MTIFEKFKHNTQIMKQLFFCLSIFLLFSSCKKNETKSKISADNEITEKVKMLYTNYGKSSDAIYDRAIPKDLLSPELEKTFQEAINTSKADIEKVKKSDHPTDKPLLMEGSIFTSLYEGYTSYKIKSIDVMESTKPLGMAADVTVSLENSNYPNEKDAKWVDTIHLVNILDSGWRIDNVKFNNGDLKSNLQSFISGAKQ